MSLKIGDLAPIFTLKNSEGEEVSLEEFKGKPTLILFFPLAFTGVCTKELCSVRDSIAMYESLNTQVVAISVDSFFTLQKFKDEQSLNFSLLSDFNKEVSESYGALYEEFFAMKGVSKRSAFVVDKQGKIAYAEVLEKASDLPNFNAIREVIESL